MRHVMKATLAAIALVAACNSTAKDAELQRADGRRDAPQMNTELADKAKAFEAPSARVLGQVVTTGTGEPAEASSFRAPGSSYAADSIAPSMIIRTGTSSIEVDSLEPAVARVRELARRVGGYVANTQMQAGREQVRSAMLEIRLPSSRFDEVITGLHPIGRVESVNVTAEDVGEEYVDVAARVLNSHRLEQRLIEVLNTKTGKLRDVLEVERELARVREEIERMEGRMRYLRTRTSVSTFSITVHEPYPVVGERGSTSVIGDAFKQSWRNFVRFTARFIAALGTVIPAVLLIVAALAAAFKLAKGMVKRSKAEAKAE
jgi:hypothetical protein